MYQYILLIGAIVGSQAFMPEMMNMRSEPVPSYNVDNLMLRDLLERMGNEFADGGEPYLDSQESSAGIRGLEEIPLELPFDFDRIDSLIPKTSIRDQEYLRHSSLWSNQPLTSYKSNDRHKIKPSGAAAAAAVVAAAAAATADKQAKEEKPEGQLPAYCTPPNPCPVGYTSENNCIEDFENTAAFSRDYQSAQECMCDSEHMMECPGQSDNDNSALAGMAMSNADFNQIVERFQEENPFFRGEKLPIAAKKGFNIGY